MLPVALLFFVSGCNLPTTEAREQPHIDQEQVEGPANEGAPNERTVLEMVKPSPVIGTISQDADVFSSPGGQDLAGTLTEGTEVVIVKDKGYQWYCVHDELTGISGWVSPDFLSIPPDPPTNEELMTREEVESYVNDSEMESATPYLVWVDIDRQLTHVLQGEEGDWRLAKTLVCSTGENISPTLRGTFTLEERGEWFYNPTFSSGGKYWVRYSGAYLFHSVAMNRDQTVQDPTLGKRASAGCIRLSVDGAKWFYETVPTGTKVFVN